MRFLRFTLAACGSSTVAVPPSNTAVFGRPLEPVVIAPAADAACPLGWVELDETAPRRLPLHRALDKCEGVPDTEHECEDCSRAGTVASGARASHVVSGPEGSGRFWSWTLTVGDRFACGTGSTVGWRHLAGAGEQIAPLRWFADVDGDGIHEVVVWHRLSWGHSELANGLIPIVYAVNASDLVRRDDIAKPLRAKVAAMYASLANHDGALRELLPCYQAISSALD